MQREPRRREFRHMASALMRDGAVSLKCPQEILGEQSERTTLSIYVNSMHRTYDDSAEKIAALARLSQIIVGSN